MSDLDPATEETQLDIDELREVVVEAALADKVAKRKPGQRGPTSDSAKIRRRKVKVLELSAKEIPTKAIATYLGVDEKTVDRDLAEFRKVFRQLDKIESYRANRRDILTATEIELLQSMMSQDKLDKASVNNLAYAYRQVHDTRRLEEGLSTSNTASTVRFTRVDVEDRAVASE